MTPRQRRIGGISRRCCTPHARCGAAFCEQQGDARAQKAKEFMVFFQPPFLNQHSRALEFADSDEGLADSFPSYGHCLTMLLKYGARRQISELAKQGGPPLVRPMEGGTNWQRGFLRRRTIALAHAPRCRQGQGRSARTRHDVEPAAEGHSHAPPPRRGGVRRSPPAPGARALGRRRRRRI